jgi:hypothetical protein
MSYNPKSKPGILRLWSSFNGSTLGVTSDPIKNGDSSWLEFLAGQNRRSPALGSNIYVTLSLGNDDDIFSILAAIMMIKKGKDYSFKNYAGRMISFSRSIVGNRNDEVILVNISHKTDTGMITLQEITEFETVTRNILANIGYSKQKISDKVEQIMAQSSIQGDENIKNTR